MNPAQNAKLKKLLSTSMDDPNLLPALKHLSLFYSENTIENRSNLRSDIEKKTLETEKNFLKAFEDVQKELEKVEKDMKGIVSTCHQMRDRVTNIRIAASDIIEKTDVLQNKKALLEGKGKIASNFLEKFELNANERQSLISSGPLNQEFFDSLMKLKKKREDAKILIRSQHQKAGVEIMDSTSDLQNQAYDKLYRWIKSEFSKMESQSPEPPDLLPLAISCLKDRTILLTYCIDEIEIARSKSIYQNFMNALTKGGRGGVPKPIELHAHDPVRFCGDMMGWIHQACATEFELLNLLFGDAGLSQSHSGGEDVGRTATKSSGPDTPSRSSSLSILHTGEIVQRLITKIFEKTTEPFKLRVEETLNNLTNYKTTNNTSSNTILTYRIANLCDFYFRTISKIMPSSSYLCQALQSLKQLSMKKFYASLPTVNENSSPIPVASLAPIQLVIDGVSKLSEIILVFDASLVPTNEREKEISPVLSALIDPVITTITISATTLTNPIHVSVFLINCFDCIDNVLESYPFALQQHNHITAQIEAHMDTLIQEETSLFLAKVNLKKKLLILQEHDMKKPLSLVEGMDRRELSEAVRQFENSLGEIGSINLPHVEKLQSQRRRREAKDKIFVLIADAYDQLYKAVMDPTNKYDNPSLIMNYSTNQIHEILGISPT